MRHTIRLALLLVAAASCHRNSAPQGAPVTEVISEANVVAIILAANNTDLSYARMVPNRVKSPAVKTFAQRMMTDHTTFNARLTEIAEHLDIRPEDNATSLEYRDYSAQRRDMLRNLEGATFDAAYAQNEIQFHTDLLAIIDKVLGPNTRTPELREFLIQFKPAMSAHLGHAEQMKASVAQGQ
jgi:putative membrane protein